MANDELNFLEFLQSFRRGELLDHGNEKLHEVINAVAMYGSKGSITIVLPFEVNKAGQIECAPSISAKLPVKPMGTGIYYATDEGTLCRRDPRQLDMIDEIETRRARDN